jgi:hypothetical protein
VATLLDAYPGRAELLPVVLDTQGLRDLLARTPAHQACSEMKLEMTELPDPLPEPPWKLGQLPCTVQFSPSFSGTSGLFIAKIKKLK